MPGFVCTEHPASPATFSCDGCARLLCAACAREGHRLIFCLLCGERALPLDSNASAVVPERQRQERINRKYTFEEALRYVFRGHGRLILPGYILSLTIFNAVPGLGLLGMFITLLMPGFLFSIAYTTADGDDTLPDWPDYADLGDRLRELGWLLLVVAVSLVPAIFFFRVLGCDLGLFLLGLGGASCWLALVAGAVLGSLIGVLAFGAVAYNSSGWLSFRIDLHLRALTTGARGDVLKTAGLVALLFIVSQVVAMALRPLPLFGAAVESAFTGYALFTGAHLVGLVFRRHSEELNAIYRN